jgi:hypothetical protein
MDQAPEWTNKISNNVLCGYFYVFFVIFSVWAGLSLLGGVWIFATTKMGFGMLLAVAFNILLSFGISATSALFLYLICERALKPYANPYVADATAQVGSVSDYKMM